MLFSSSGYAQTHSVLADTTRTQRTRGTSEGMSVLHPSPFGLSRTAGPHTTHDPAVFGWNWQLVERMIITIAPMLVQYFSRSSAGCVAKRFMEWLGTLGGVQVGGVRSVPRLTAPATTAAFPRIDGMKVCFAQ